MSDRFPTELPPVRDPSGPYRICCICLGNICRSPTAEVVLRSRVAAAGLGAAVAVDSGGTGDWHLGDPMDSRARAVLRNGGYALAHHGARRIDADWFDSHDLFLAMDRANLANVRAMAPDPVSAATRVMLFRAFDPLADDVDSEVPDPYYGSMDQYRDVLTVVERTADALVDRLAAQLGAQPQDR
jgi:low molecular weight protein-tyrosine phosphatase